jgi:hypothetical protein
MNPPNEDMKRIDELLKTALVREEAPQGFAQRVLARVEQRSTVTPKAERVPQSHVLSRPLVRWAAFAGISASLIAGSIHYRNARHEQAEGEAAKQRLMLALHIAGSKLQLARSKVNGIQTSQPYREHETNKSRSKS